MSAILDLPEARQRVLRWSVAEYEQLVEQGIVGKRAELLRGIVVEKIAKSPLHCAIAKWLYDRILVQVPQELTVRFESPLRLADSEPEPDVAVVRGSASDFRHAHPATAELVIEIAVSSAALDRQNAQLYAEANVTEYWIVLGREQQIEVFRQPREGAYREHHVYTREDTLRCEAVPQIRFSLGELFE
jgi:Uma2 family endonuclease